MVTLKVQGLLTKASKSSLVLPFILYPESNLSVIVDCPVFKICLSLDDCWLFCLNILFCSDQSCCSMIFPFSLTQWTWRPFFLTFWSLLNWQPTWFPSQTISHLCPELMYVQDSNQRENLGGSLKNVVPSSVSNSSSLPPSLHSL